MQEKIIEISVIAAKKFYLYTPLPLRFAFFPLKLLLKLKFIVDTMKLDLWRLSGREKVTKETLTILYAGIEKNKNYFADMTFKNQFTENYIGKLWFWDVFKRIKYVDHVGSIVVIEIHRFFRKLLNKKRYFYVPCWIIGDVNIPSDISLLFKSRNLKRDVKRIRKNKFEFEVTKDVDQFDFFYNEMYQPYVSKTYSDGALIWDYEVMRNKFRECELLLIKKENEYVAGVLINTAECVPRGWVLGVLGGDVAQVRSGVLHATYYFALQYCKEKGYSKYSFGHTRAFLENGVLQYKRKWSLELADISQTGFLIRPLSRTPGTEAFLLNNPFIYIDKDRFNGSVFVGNSELSEKGFYRKVYKKYFFPGMDKLFLYQLGDSHSQLKEIYPAELTDEMAVRSAEDVF